jgi:hypothetical protein
MSKKIQTIKKQKKMKMKTNEMKPAQSPGAPGGQGCCCNKQ